MSKHLYTYINPTSKKHLDKAIDVLDNDGIIILPTDVNWAFVCDASKPKAIERLYSLKPLHPKDRPFSLICSTLAMASGVAHLDNFAFRVLKKTLPGPYTVLLNRSKNLPKKIKDKRRFVGIRIPSSQLILDLVNQYEKPLLASSVLSEIKKNDSEPIQEVYGYQIEQEYGHKVDLILDLGEPLVFNETTIIDLSDGEVQIIRRGIGDIHVFKKAENI